MGRPHFLIFKTSNTAWWEKPLPTPARHPGDLRLQYQKTGIRYCALLIAEVDVSKPLPLDVPISPLEVIHLATVACVHKEYPKTLNHSLHSDAELGNMRHSGSEIMLRKYAQPVAGEMHDVQVRWFEGCGLSEGQNLLPQIVDSNAFQ